jgi:hypothetical protein
MKTEELIAKLSNEQSKKTLQTPRYYASCLVAVLIIYAILVQFYLGLRSDLSAQLLKKSFLLEIFLLFSLGIFSAIASIFLIYPDCHQKKILIKIPNFLLVATISFTLLQLLLPEESLLLITANSHNIECSICIAAVAIIPSLLIFNLIKKGAATSFKKAGFFAILTTTSIGCITLRLAENNDAAMHLLVWHYLPTLLFSCLGALAGKYFLKW